MYILKVDANKEQFRTVEFDKIGINIITGKKVNENTGKTYNGVGKSLLIRIIDFCLGSNPSKGLAKLKGWIFYLDIEIDNEIYKIARSTENQNEIMVNSTQYTLDVFRDFLGNKLFPNTGTRKYLTYRTLISRFLRPKKESYISCDKIYIKEGEYCELINLSYLLGLNPELVENKLKLRESYSEENKIGTFYKNDFRLKGLLEKGQDIKIKIVNLRKDLEELESKLKEYKVGQEFTDLLKDKEELSKKRDSLVNELFLLTNKEEMLMKNLERKPDISNETIVNLFEQANLHFSNLVKKSLEEVNDFHKKMLINRQNRFKKELEIVRPKQEKLKKELDRINTQIDKFGEVFKNSGTFEEFEVLNNKAKEKKIEIHDLEKYQELITASNTAKKKFKLEMKKEDIRVDEFILEKKEYIENMIDDFNNITKEFYSDKESGISIINNSKNNKKRYDFNAYIESDTSDGINEVKIFSFDLLLLILGNTKNNFITHDSRLLANMDGRQQVTLFRVANEYFNKLNKQYIISINENMLSGMKDEEDWKKIAHLFEGKERRVKLELTDENDESKLLGETIPFDYEK